MRTQIQDEPKEIIAWLKLKLGDELPPLELLFKLISARDAADALATSPKHLANQRYRGEGCAYVKDKGRVKYPYYLVLHYQLTQMEFVSHRDPRDSPAGAQAPSPRRVRKKRNISSNARRRPARAA
jgi:hypothetical protein